MKENKINFKAFTIMEMLVTLTLSGIIVVASFQFYLNYQKLTNKKKHQMDCGNEALVFYETFKREFENALEISSFDGEKIIFKENQKVIQYEFGNKYVIRNYRARIDTFFFKVDVFSMEKDKISGFVKKVNLELSNCNGVYPITLIKNFPNCILMNQREIE